MGHSGANDELEVGERQRTIVRILSLSLSLSLAKTVVNQANGIHRVPMLMSSIYDVMPGTGRSGRANCCMLLQSLHKCHI